MRLAAKSRVVLLGCSNGWQRTDENIAKLQALISTLVDMYQWQVEVADTVWRDTPTGVSYHGEQRAQILVNALCDTKVQAIFDLTGGDLANDTLSAIDWARLTQIQRPTPIYLVGYSDNTVLLNAFMPLPWLLPVNFFLPMILADGSQRTRQAFESFFLGGAEVPAISAVGGNIRCLLKLAGTPYWPDMKGKCLLLEASSGNVDRIISYIAQLSQMSVFSLVSHIVVGQLNEVDQSGERQMVLDYLAQQTSVLIVETDYLGHRAPLHPFSFKEEI